MNLDALTQQLIELVPPENRGQAEQLAERIRELHAGEQQNTSWPSNAARIAALNMMRDAVLAKQRLELTQFALDHAHTSVFRISKDASIQYATHAAYHKLGYSKDELVNLSVPDIAPDMSPERWAAYWNEARAKKFFHFEGHLRSRDGTIFPVEIHVNFIEHDGEEYIFSFVHDITERKKAEEAAAREQERLQRIFDALPIGVSLNRTHGDGSEVRLINEAHLRIAGIRRDEDKPETWRRINHPDNRDEQDAFRYAMDGGKIKLFTVDKRYVHPDGHTVWVEFSRRRLMLDNGGFEDLCTAVDITSRKKAEEALRESEERYRSTINDLPVGVMVHAEDTRIVLSNPAACRMLGLTAEQIAGKTAEDPVWKFVREDLSEMPREEFPVYRVMATGKSISNQIIGIMKPGQTEPTWIIANAVRIFSQNSYLFRIIVNFMDITERKTAETALRDSEERFKSLHNASFGGIAIHNQGMILECNRGLSVLTGYAQEELIGMNGLLLIAEESRELTKDKIRSGLEHSYEVTGLRKNGETYPLRLEARNIVYQGIQARTVEFRDITEQKKAEAELRLLSTAVEQSPEITIITDPAGTIQYVNPAFETATGFSMDEAIGRTPRLLKSGEHPPAFYTEMWAALSNGKVWKGEIVNRRKDQTLYTVEACISPVITDNIIVSYVAVMRDITQEKSKEEELRQAHKMEAIGQLAGGIAHDFNNILQGILGFSEMLLYDLNEASEAHDRALEIHQAANKAATLTQQLLTFSRKQTVQLSEVDLNGTIHDAEALLHVLLGENHELVLDLQDDLPPVHADYGQLTQIIMNLSVNARDAMSGGGRLSISTESVIITATDATYLTGARPGHYQCLAVTDTGCGMDADTKAHIFDPFFTTKAIGTGTGLGLSVIYGIVEQSKGWINVYSELGKGTCFKIFLPSTEIAESQAETGEAPAAARNARILLVDDDPKLCNMMVEVLGNAAYTIAAASSAEEGLAIFREQAGEFDLLMSDMQLPGMCGDKLAEMLRIMNPELPVLLLSGYQDQAKRWKHFAEQGYLFLSKPFTPHVLLDNIAMILKDNEGD